MGLALLIRRATCGRGPAVPYREDWTPIRDEGFASYARRVGRPYARPSPAISTRRGRAGPSGRSGAPGDGERRARPDRPPVVTHAGDDRRTAGAPARAVPGAERRVLAAVALGSTRSAQLDDDRGALPSIVDDFGTGVGTASWLVTSYLLALAVVQPVAGKLGDRYGRRPFVLGGLVVFGLASIGAALAPSLALLIAFRMLQAISGAVVFPNGSGLVRQLVPEGRRAAAFGLIGSALSLAAALGPPAGGILVSAGGWRTIFWVNIPIVAVALLLARGAIPRAGRPAGAHAVRLARQRPEHSWQSPANDIFSAC